MNDNQKYYLYSSVGYLSTFAGLIFGVVAVFALLINNEYIFSIFISLTALFIITAAGLGYVVDKQLETIKSQIRWLD